MQSAYNIALQQMANKKPKKRKKPDLPDELIYKKPHGRGAAKHRHRKEHNDKIKKEDLNPTGKEDFDTILRQLLQTKGDDLI